jgi:DNA-binding MarR family transcriptional regulator
MLLFRIFAFMKIEDEIKQEHFESNLHKALVNLLYTFNWHRDLLHSIFKQYDLQQQHYNILRILKGKHPEPVSPGYIKEVMLDKGTDLTRLLDKLERKNLINRKLCPSNRRKIDINLTSEGIALLDKVRPTFDKQHELLANNLTDNEAEMLSNLLDKLRG